jgi:hypothetical protein
MVINIYNIHLNLSLLGLQLRRSSSLHRPGPDLWGWPAGGRVDVETMSTNDTWRLSPQKTGKVLEQCHVDGENDDIP